MSGDLQFYRRASAANQLQHECHKAAYDAGWWHTPGRTSDLAVLVRSSEGGLLPGAVVAQKLCLIHSEVSEAMEGHRKNKMDDHLKHRKAIEVELADALIRIFDLAGALGLNIGDALAEKMEYNANRADHKEENRKAAGGKAY